MDLDNIKQRTTWNDAAESINSNFAKIRQAILSLQAEGGGLDESQLEEYLLANGYTKEEWVLAQNALLEERIEVLEQEGGAVNVEGSAFISVSQDGVISLDVDAQGGLGQTQQGLGIVDIPSHLLEGIKIDVDTAMSDTSENAVQNKVVKQYVDQLRADFDAIVNGDASAAIESINEILAFLSTIEDTTTLEGIIAGLKASMEKYTDDEVAHIEGVLNARIDGIVHVVYYYDGLSEEHKAENKKAYDAIMAGSDSCYVITDKTSSTKIIATAALKSSTIAGLMAYQMMPTSKDEITIGILSLSLYEDGSTAQTTTQSYVLNREAVIALLEGKQDALISGTTIKTINGQDILGEGDIVIEGGGSDIEVDSSLDMYSENPIQNQAVAKQFSGLSEYLQERHESYNQNFTNLSGQLPWISIVDFEAAIEQEEPIGDDVRNALLEIGGYNPDKPYSTQGWVWSQGYLYTIKVIPTESGVQIQLFSFKGWTEIAEDNSKVNHLPSQGSGNVEVDAELSETSENAVSNKVVTMALAETEEVAAAALNELNERFDDYATKEDIDATLAEMDEEINHIEGVIEATIIEDEEVAAAALVDLDKRVTNLEQNGGGGGGGDIYNVSFAIDPSTMELVMAYDVQPTFDFTLDENGNLIAII